MDMSLKSEVLLQALPYIKKYSGEIVVVKYGGNAMVNDELKAAVMQDLTLLWQIGVKIVLVHGGGPEINQTLQKMNIESKFSGGLRVTDKNTMDVVQMSLCGKVNKDLVNLLELCGAKAIGICGTDGGLLKAKCLKEELGYVGSITEVKAKIIFDLLDCGYIPVISTVASDGLGGVFNVNADTVAAKVAGELKAKSFISMTDVKGILAKRDDDTTLISSINVSETSELIKEGIISGGMIPKVQCCVEAIRRGVGKVFIIDGRVPHSILIEILSDEGIGTMFY